MNVFIQKDHIAWAQALHADGLKKYAPPGISVTTGLLTDPITADADAVYTINMASTRKLKNKRVATCCASHAWLYPSNDPSNWRTRGVNPRRNSDLGYTLIQRADAVVCRNKALEKWASVHHRSARCFPAGIDPELWHPGGRRPNTGKLRVGWCGQVNPEPQGRFKGWDEIMCPLMDRCGDRYEFTTNTRTAEDALSWSELADWMRSLDVFLTTASAEGTPNTVMQAAACGAVVISTAVGQCADWAFLKEADLVVPDYGTPAEAEVVIDAITQRLEMLESASVRSIAREFLLRSIAEEFSYKVLAKPTLEFVCGVTL